MMKYLVIALILSSTNLVFSADSKIPKKPNKTICSDVLDPSKSKGPSVARASDPVSLAVKATASWIAENKSIPSLEELAEELKMPNIKLRAELNALPGRSKMDALIDLAKVRFPEKFTFFEKDLAKLLGKYLRDHYFLPDREELIGRLLDISNREYIQFYKPLMDDPIAIIEKNSPEFLEVTRNRMIQKFADESKKRGQTPTLKQFAFAEGAGAESDRFEELFGEKGLFKSFDVLVNEAIRQKPASFASVLDARLFNEERTEKLIQAVKKRRRLVLVTALAGAPVNRDFLGALLNFCEKEDAEILVFPANMQTTGLDEILINTPKVHIITNSIELSPYLALNAIKVMPKAINSLMGLNGLGGPNQSQIFGAPKQHTLVVPTMDNKYEAHRIMTTGSITDPFYSGEKIIQDRTDKIAANDHVIGALILEKSNNDEGNVPIPGLEGFGRFHTRQIEFIADENGFMNLTKFYTEKEILPIQPEALVLGDIHVGDTDGRVLESVKDLILNLKPKRIVLHDLLNGHSISHHELGNVSAQSSKVNSGRNNLREELVQVVHFLNSILDLDPHLEIVIVSSNHNEWLDRWIKAGRYIFDPENTSLGLELALVKDTGGDVLKHALLEPGIELPHRPLMQNDSRSHVRTVVYDRTRVVFKDAGESFKVGTAKMPVELALHGHAGPNGGRGSVKNIEIATGRAVFGHTHTYARRNGSVNVGTSTFKTLSYSKDGFSNWVQSAAIVGPNGEIQVLEFENGSWYSDPDGKPSRNHFFLSGYPKVESNNEKNTGGQIDQYGGK